MNKEALILLKDADIWAKRRNLEKAIEILHIALGKIDENNHCHDYQKIVKKIKNLESWLSRIINSEGREIKGDVCAMCGAQIDEDVDDNDEEGNPLCHECSEEYNDNLEDLEAWASHYYYESRRYDDDFDWYDEVDQ